MPAATPTDRGRRREIELRASIAARTGSLREALDFLLVAADRAASADDETIALADAVHATYYLGDARTASALADRLAALRPAVTEPRARALGLMATGMARTLAGRGGADDIRAAVPLLETDPDLGHDPRRLSWLLLAPLFLRDATSGARLRALVEEVRGAAGIGALPAVLFHVAVDQSTTGAVLGARRGELHRGDPAGRRDRPGHRARDVARGTGAARFAGRAGGGVPCARRARRRRCALRATSTSARSGSRHAVGDLELSLGQRRTRCGPRFAELVALLERLGLDDVDLAPAPELADALLRLGRRAEAVPVVAASTGRARGGEGAAVGAARAPTGPLGWRPRTTSSRRGSSRRCDWHEQTLDRFEDARTRLAYGSRLRRVWPTGRRAGAAAVGARHRSRISGRPCGAISAAAELAATGEHVRTAGVNALAGLTPQELQVSLCSPRAAPPARPPPRCS